MTAEIAAHTAAAPPAVLDAQAPFLQDMCAFRRRCPPPSQPACRRRPPRAGCGWPPLPAADQAENPLEFYVLERRRLVAEAAVAAGLLGAAAVAAGDVSTAEAAAELLLRVAGTAEPGADQWSAYMTRMSCRWAALSQPTLQLPSLPPKPS